VIRTSQSQFRLPWLSYQSSRNLWFNYLYWISSNLCHCYLL